MNKFIWTNTFDYLNEMDKYSKEKFTKRDQKRTDHLNGPILIKVIVITY